MRFLLITSIIFAASAHAAVLPAEQVKFFEEKIRPALVEHCYKCHSKEAEKLKGGLFLDSRAGWEKGGDTGEPVIIPGKPDESLFIQSIRHDDEDLAMPPKKPKLPDSVIADFVAWVKMGAPDPRDGAIELQRADKDWWSLQPLANPAPPEPAGLPETWKQNPIDRFIFATLAAKGLQPNPPADPRTLIRRMTYDLTGLPPTFEEVAAFTEAVATNRHQAIEQLVDRLLASPRYGEHWGRHWLDVVRFGESNGFERNIVIDTLWPFRDYVIRSHNEDKPFNRFMIEHLAGDVVGKDDPAVEVGTAFLVAGPYDDVGNKDVVAQANIRAGTLDDVVNATSSAFLGLTVSCARCHHHKFDPIPTEDYYRIRAAFEGVQHGERVIASVEERKRFTEATRPLEEKKAQLVKERDAEEKIIRAATLEQQTRLNEIRQQIKAVEAELKSVPNLRKIWAGIFQEFKKPTHVHKGGDPMKPMEPVLPASLAVLDRVTEPFALPADAPEGKRRLALAEWIASDKNPLTARVLANRVWHYHFGTGLVDTPGDFGFLGSKPTHPELLDFLASRLHVHGWRLKALHREILLSQTWQQSSAFREDGARADKDARLFWRFPPRRLAAEEVRDTMLATAGKLDLKMGGPGFRLYHFMRDNVCTYTPLDKHGPETYRRAVYHQNVRASVVDVLSDFDLPDTAFPAPRRANTTTPLQSLTLLNHQFTLDMTDALVSRMNGTDAEAIRRAFNIAFQREPTASETGAASRLIAAHGTRAFCRGLLNTNELLRLE